MSEKQLYNLIPTHFPQTVLNEVVVILGMIRPGFNARPVLSAFNSTVDLFEGNYSGYQACNTEYHDLRHTTETFLAMARLIHGAVLDGEAFTDRQVTLGLISALLHDAGYIQTEFDTIGTGSKYTAIHVRRSMDFLRRHGSDFKLSEKEIVDCRAIILCTDLAADIIATEFSSAAVALLGKMLASADILAQMADRTYLEKLLFLYYEFKEAGVGDFKSEMDLLRKTLTFYDLMDQRLKKTLDASDRFMKPHFVNRWQINENLYQIAIKRQRNYLKQVLEIHKSDPRDRLRRGGIVAQIRNG